MQLQIKKALAVIVASLLLSFLVIAQQRLEIKRQSPASDRLRIPEASLPSTSEEAKWWEELRAAGAALRQKKDSKKLKEQFMSLLGYGIQRDYRAPIPDRKIVMVAMTEPSYSDDARRRRIRGRVSLLVEFRADGFVGEVKVLNSLDYSLDERAVEAARRCVFLPAVKDRKFVTSSGQMEMSFSFY